MNMQGRIQQMLVASVLALVLTGIFRAYLRPDFIVDLANRLMMCL